MKYCLRAILTLFVLVSGSETDAQVVFHYRIFPFDGALRPLIQDVGPARNHGTADESLKFSRDIAMDGVSSDAGLRSLNSRGQVGVLSGGTQELANSLIAEAGGFTMESWFKWNGGGTVNSILDYAGTEKLVIDTSLGAGNEVRMRINDESAADSVIGTVERFQWHYVAVVFDTLGNSVDAGSITGQFDLYLDGSLIQTTANSTITDLGDSLDRGIGTGKNPQELGGDFFDGLLFEPRVTLGALEPNQLLYVFPEPADLNMDGFVDGLDLGILLANFEQNGIPLSGGELNGMDPVDGLDLGILLGAWNPPLLLGQWSAVPEPAGLALLTLAGIALIATRPIRSLTED